jgi:geranylgeranyl diphosphate synthase, type II
VAMLRVAAEGQRELCRGQGAELLWTNAPVALSTPQVVEIFRSKTAPAFEVALKVGAAFAGQLEDVADALHSYSEALGIAYQIHDDLDDLGDDATTDNANVSIRPSIVLSLLREKGKGEVKETLEALWTGKATTLPSKAQIRDWAESSGARDKTLIQLESFKEAAVRSLQEVENANLKGLLRRVIGKIFNDLEIKGWCREFEVKNITSEAKAQAAEAAADLVPAAAVAAA